MNLRAFRDAEGSFRDRNAIDIHYAISIEKCVQRSTQCEKKSILKGGTSHGVYDDAYPADAWHCDTHR